MAYPLQTAEPGPEIVDEHAEGADEFGRVGDVGAIEAVRLEITTVARLGKGQVGVELDPARRSIFGGTLWKWCR